MHEFSNSSNFMEIWTACLEIEKNGKRNDSIYGTFSFSSTYCQKFIQM